MFGSAVTGLFVRGSSDLDVSVVLDVGEILYVHRERERERERLRFASYRIRKRRERELARVVEDSDIDEMEGDSERFHDNTHEWNENLRKPPASQRKKDRRKLETEGDPVSELHGWTVHSVEQERETLYRRCVDLDNAPRVSDLSRTDQLVIRRATLKALRQAANILRRGLFFSISFRISIHFLGNV